MQVRELIPVADEAPIQSARVREQRDAEPLRREQRHHRIGLGHARAEHFVSPGGFFPDHDKNYRLPETLALNRWGLSGTWTVREQYARLDRADGAITFRFRARDLNLVLGPGPDGKPVRFTVTVDGQPPGDNHGVDIDAAGKGTVANQRLYQLIRCSDGVRERSFEIRFEDPGVEAFAFTFG